MLHLTALQNLDLRYNRAISHTLTHYLCLSIPDPSLPSTHASGNNIGPHGATAIGEALTTVTSLTSLDMGCQPPSPRIKPPMPSWGWGGLDR